MNICRYDRHNKVIEKNSQDHERLFQTKKIVRRFSLKSSSVWQKKLAKCRKSKQNNNPADPEASGRNVIYDVNIDRLVMVMRFF